MNTKWIAISLGTVLGLSHIGMIGIISRQQKFPIVTLPAIPTCAVIKHPFPIVTL